MSRYDYFEESTSMLKTKLHTQASSKTLKGLADKSDELVKAGWRPSGPLCMLEGLYTRSFYKYEPVKNGWPELNRTH